MGRNRNLFILLSVLVVVTIFVSCNKPNPDPIIKPFPTFSPLPSPPTSPTPEASPTISPQPSSSPSSSSSPSPTPGTCPCLVRWALNSDAYVKLDPNHQITDKYVVGGWAIFDSTQRFADHQGDTRGKACDHLPYEACLARGCEDLNNGPKFTYDGPSHGQVNSNNYQYKVGPLRSGHHTLKVEPRADLQDSLGFPVEVCPWIQDATTTSEFDL